MLNQNTFFAVSEIDHQYKTPSACHFIYGDGKYLRVLFVNTFLLLCLILLLWHIWHFCTHPGNLVQNTEEMVRTDGLSDKQFEQVTLF